MFSRRKLSTDRGFTMLETVVSVFILAMLGPALVALIIHSVKGWSSGTSRVNADTAAAVAVRRLNEDIRLGRSASVVDGELRVVVQPLITDAYGEQYYDTAAAGTTYRYYLSDGIIYRQIGANAATVFARDVSSVSFSVTGEIVTVVVTGQNQVGMSQSERETTARVRLRNTSS